MALLPAAVAQPVEVEVGASLSRSSMLEWPRPQEVGAHLGAAQQMQLPLREERGEGAAPLPPPLLSQVRGKVGDAACLDEREAAAVG